MYIRSYIHLLFNVQNIRTSACFRYTTEERNFIPHIYVGSIITFIESNSIYSLNDRLNNFSVCNEHIISNSKERMNIIYYKRDRYIYTYNGAVQTFIHLPSTSVKSPFRN